MVNVAVLVAVKRTDAFLFLNLHFVFTVIVGKHPALDLLRRERHVEIKIEIRLERGKPFELPAHALLERLNFRQRRAGNDGESRVALSNVNVHAVEMVGPKRAMRATFLPARPEHEVIDNELALAAEQIGERHLARRPVENVFLFDFDPRQLATLKVQFVAQFRELLFLNQKLLAGDKPFFLRNHLPVFDSADGFDFRHNVLLCFIVATL